MKRLACLLLLCAALPAEAGHRHSAPVAPPPPPVVTTPPPSASLVYFAHAIEAEVCRPGLGCEQFGDTAFGRFDGPALAAGTVGALLSGTAAFDAFSGTQGSLDGAGHIYSGYGSVMANWPDEQGSVVPYGPGRAYAVTDGYFIAGFDLSPEVVLPPNPFQQALQVQAGVSAGCGSKFTQIRVTNVGFFGVRVPDVVAGNDAPNQTFTANGAKLVLNEHLPDGAVIGLHLTRANGQEVKVGVVKAGVSGCP